MVVNVGALVLAVMVNGVAGMSLPVWSLTAARMPADDGAPKNSELNTPPLMLPYLALMPILPTMAFGA